VNCNPRSSTSHVLQCARTAVGNEELFREVIDLFITEAPRQIEELRQAIDAGNLDAVERISHSIRGELACLGFTKVAERAGILEELGRGGEFDKIGDAFQRLRTELVTLTEEVRSSQY
jgi:HPt (histidine-containing phosphotransfer) domain-containing protein